MWKQQKKTKLHWKNWLWKHHRQSRSRLNRRIHPQIQSCLQKKQTAVRKLCRKKHSSHLTRQNSHSRQKLQQRTLHLKKKQKAAKKLYWRRLLKLLKLQFPVQTATCHQTMSFLQAMLNSSFMTVRLHFLVYQQETVLMIPSRKYMTFLKKK